MVGNQATMIANSVLTLDDPIDKRCLKEIRRDDTQPQEIYSDSNRALYKKGMLN